MKRSYGICKRHCLRLLLWATQMHEERHTAIWRPMPIRRESRITSGCSMTAYLTAVRQPLSIRDNDKRTAAAFAAAVLYVQSWLESVGQLIQQGGQFLQLLIW